MRFKPLYLNNPTLFQETLLSLGYNIFKIKYFYEEDQLNNLSRQINDPEALAFIISKYQNVADEATTYLKAVTAFRNGNASLPKDQEHFEYILSYFTQKKVDLANSELEGEKRFLYWLKDKEYSE